MYVHVVYIPYTLKLLEQQDEWIDILDGKFKVIYSSVPTCTEDA